MGDRRRYRAAGDEVGCASAVGPIVTCVVVATGPVRFHPLVRDSKTLSPQQRERVVDWAKSQNRLVWAYGAVSHREADRYGMIRARALAFDRAVARLPFAPDELVILIDGDRLPVSFRARFVPKADATDQLCALASILAKTLRDALLTRLSVFFPGYGWERNKGYLTKEHIDALRTLGPTRLHRWRHIDSIVQPTLLL